MFGTVSIWITNLKPIVVVIDSWVLGSIYAASSCIVIIKALRGSWLGHRSLGGSATPTNPYIPPYQTGPYTKWATQATNKLTQTFEFPHPWGLQPAKVQGILRNQTSFLIVSLDYRGQANKVQRSNWPNKQPSNALNCGLQKKQMKQSDCGHSKPYWRLCSFKISLNPFEILSSSFYISSEASYFYYLTKNYTCLPLFLCQRNY